MACARAFDALLERVAALTMPHLQGGMAQSVDQAEGAGGSTDDQDSANSELDEDDDEDEDDDDSSEEDDDDEEVGLSLADSANQ